MHGSFYGGFEKHASRPDTLTNAAIGAGAGAGLGAGLAKKLARKLKYVI